MMLDVTAGNRMLWPNKKPLDTIFMDKEVDLKIPPDIFGSWFHLPFRHGVIDCIMFDPPHCYGGFSGKSIHADPKAKRGSWWGIFKNRRELNISLFKASKEFLKTAPRLCLKWNDNQVPLWNILVWFKGWKEINRWERKSGSNISKSQTYWVTFINSQFTNKGEKEVSV